MPKPKRKYATRPPGVRGYWNRFLELEGHSMGSKRKINADIEAIDPVRASKADQKKAVKSGDMTQRDVFLSMHYRAAKVQEMARRLNVPIHTIQEMLGNLYEETDRELVNSPEEMKAEIGGTYMRWIRKIDGRFMSDQATPAEIRCGILMLANLAKLTGANSPDLQVIKSYTATVDVNKAVEQRRELETADILNDPVMRDAQMIIEMRRLELENGVGRPDQKSLVARVLPGRGEEAGGEQVPLPAPHPDDDDEPDEAGGA